MQTVWKLWLKGSGLRLGSGSLPHGTHSRSRPLPDAALAGDGGRLRRPGQSGALHRGLRGWAPPWDGRPCSGRRPNDRPAGFARVEPKPTGRPGYAPADLLKLYIYGYLNRVRSSRRLEAEAGRNIEVIWLLRHLQPDFKTIADFRRDNRNAFRQVFRAFVLL